MCCRMTALVCTLGTSVSVVAEAAVVRVDHEDCGLVPQRGSFGPSEHGVENQFLRIQQCKKQG